MRGIKDMQSLLFWMDNSTGPSLDKVLNNQRRITPHKRSLLRDLRDRPSREWPRRGLDFGPRPPRS